MVDGTVTVAPDSTGKRIDTSEITRASGVVIERQRVVIGDPSDPQQASVDVRGEDGKGYMVIDANVLACLRSVDESLKSIHELLMRFLCS